MTTVLCKSLSTTFSFITLLIFTKFIILYFVRLPTYTYCVCVLSAPSLPLLIFLHSFSGKTQSLWARGKVAAGFFLKKDERKQIPFLRFLLLKLVNNNSHQLRESKSSRKRREYSGNCGHTENGTKFKFIQILRPKLSAKFSSERRCLLSAAAWNAIKI